MDPTLDFTLLRMTFAGSEAFAPYGTENGEFRERAGAALDSEEYALARSILDSLLTSSIVDLEGHAMAAYAARSMEDDSAASYHGWMLNGLLTSIVQSGDGTAQSPYVVIQVSEEYAFAASRGLYRSGLQALGSCDTGPCDSIEFKDRDTGEEVTLWFDVAIPMNWLSRSLD